MYEPLVLDNEIGVELQQRRGSEELRAMAIAKGMRTLQDDGLRLARTGVTRLDEVLRVARAYDETEDAAHHGGRAQHVELSVRDRSPRSLFPGH